MFKRTSYRRRPRRLSNRDRRGRRRYGTAHTMDAKLIQFFETIVYVIMGMTVFSIGFLIIRAVTPFSIRKEIEEDQNIALGIIIGAVILGLAMIIAAAISG